MKFLRAKEPVVVTPTVEKGKFKKKPKVVAQRVLTKLPNPVLVNLKEIGRAHV